MPLQIIRQDITKMKVDAIVNTTNEEMVGYSGVDFAVHEGAGAELDKECRHLAPLGLGTAKITKGYNLDAKYIIHTSGPIWQGGLAGESIILKSCYLESLKLAVENGCESVAFPLISAGTYGYPKDKVLKFAVQIITEFLFTHELTVYLCVFDRTSYEFSKELFNEISKFIDDDYGFKEKRGFTHRFNSRAANRRCDTCEDESATAVFPECDVSEKSLPIPCMAPCAPMPPMQKPEHADARDKSLEEYMKAMDKSFAYKLFDYIDSKGMTDVECYKKANVDKKTFSKIKCNPQNYRPSKQTAVAFAIALELTIDETQDLLSSAGLTLSRSFVFDKIIRYFIQKGNYNIFEINEALFEFDQVLLGC
ncbi:MAG: macro domain-containing protein [Clostridia bacterium]|nr:macro domain-containing protein [Clostridia bacterium]